MNKITSVDEQQLAALAQKHGFSLDALHVLRSAFLSGGGRMAQFNHPELGGMGQWSQGGMLMIGDMFNSGLKTRVGSLCQDIANFVAAEGASEQHSNAQADPEVGSLRFTESGPKYEFTHQQWWPVELGSPASSGGQNNMSYAFFPAAKRLAIQVNGQISVYDSAEHQINSFSQQQSGDQSVQFFSQHGLVKLADLTLIK